MRFDTSQLQEAHIRRFLHQPCTLTDPVFGLLRRLEGPAKIFGQTVWFGGGLQKLVTSHEYHSWELEVTADLMLTVAVRPEWVGFLFQFEGPTAFVTLSLPWRRPLVDNPYRMTVASIGATEPEAVALIIQTCSAWVRGQRPTPIGTAGAWRQPA